MGHASTAEPWYRWEGEDLLIEVRTQPRVGRAGLSPAGGERPRLRVTAAPVQGQANLQAVDVLARSFQVAKSRVRLERGHRTRVKLFRIRAPVVLPTELGIERRGSAE